MELWIDKNNVINCKGNVQRVEYPQEGYRNSDFKAAEKAIIALYGGQPCWGLMRHGKNKWSILV
jgi:hypothetical protein